MHISTHIQHKIDMRLGERGKARPFSILCPEPRLLAFSEHSFDSRSRITVTGHHTQLKSVCLIFHFTYASRDPQDGGLQISRPSLGPSYPLVDSESLVISSWCCFGVSIAPLCVCKGPGSQTPPVEELTHSMVPRGSVLFTVPPPTIIPPVTPLQSLQLPSKPSVTDILP